MVGPQPLQPLSEIQVSQLSEAKRDGPKLPLSLQIQVPEGQVVQIRLLNPLGNSVLHQNLNAEAAAKGENQLDLGQLPLGVYFLSVEAGGAKKVVKLVITDEGARFASVNPLERRKQDNLALRFEGNILRVSSPSQSQLDIHNLLGHQVGSLTVQGNQDFDVNKWNLPPGLYLVKLRSTEDSESTVKITVSR